MSEPPAEMFAFAMVFEGSCTAQECRTLLTNFMQPIGIRCTESRPGVQRQCKVGVTTYGASESIPSPVLCRRPFLDWKVFTESAKPDLAAYLMVGGMNAPGSSGLSALDGLVAAIELLQELELTIKPQTKIFKYILHLARNDPDDTTNPQWNNLLELDDMTWDSLPEELIKRNIHYNLISGLNEPEAFKRLHTKASAGKSIVPWFNIPEGFSALLSGIPTAPTPNSALPSQTQAKSAVPKRPNEAEQRQDPKRQRISDSPSQPASRPAAPKGATLPTAVPTPPPSTPTLTAAQASLPGTTTASASASGASGSASTSSISTPGPAGLMANPQAILTECVRNGKLLQQAIVAIRAEMQAANTQGDSPKLQQLGGQLKIKFEQLEQLRAKINALTQAQGLQQPARGAGGPGQQGARGPQVPPGQQPVQVASNPSSSGTPLKTSTPENHSTTGPPSGPQFGSPSLASASSLTMNQTSSSMNPMVSAQIMAQAQQAQAQARATQGQTPVGPSGGAQGAGIAGPSGPSQQSTNGTEMDKQQNEVAKLDWNRKINQKGDASNRPIPSGPAPPPPYAFPPNLLNAIASATQPEAVHPVEFGRRFQELRVLANAPHGKLQMAVRCNQLVAQLTAEIAEKSPSVKEAQKGDNPNFLNPSQGIDAVWKGTLRWQASFNGASKEVSMKVKAMHNDPSKCHGNSWTPNMLLVAPPRPAEMATVLGAWMNKHKPVVCLIEPDNGASETETLEYRTLFMQLQLALVRPEGYFAYAQWHNPTNQNQTPNAVFFSIGPKFFGAFSPLHGFPELPHEVQPSLQMVWDYATARWRQELVKGMTMFVSTLSNDVRHQVFGELVNKIRERVKENQNVQLRIIQNINGGVRNPEALNVFVMQHLEFPVPADLAMARNLSIQNQRAQQHQAQQQQAQQQQAQQQQAQQQQAQQQQVQQQQVQQQVQQQQVLQARHRMMLAQAMSQNNGANGGMGGMSLGNLGGMNFGGGIQNLGNLGGMLGMGAGVQNMGNLGNLGGMGGGGAMGMGSGMQNMGNLGGMANLGGMGGINMNNLGNLGGMGGHGGQ